MAVPIRGHRADLREFQSKFNGMHAAGRQPFASNKEQLIVIFQLDRKVSQDFGTYMADEKTKHLRKSKQMLTPPTA